MKNFYGIFLSFIMVLQCLTIPVQARPNQIQSSWIQSIQHWYSVGYDYEGESLLEEIQFPWQSTGTSLWGNSQYPMTAYLHGPETSPVYYTVFYLNLIPDSGQTRGTQKYYIVLDDHGYIWLDPDGKFQNCIYNPANDPQNPSFVSGNCQEANRLDGKIRYSVDNDSGNNTLGPYPVLSIMSEKPTIIQIEGREFLCSLLDRIDYDSKTLVQKADWDFEIKVIPFNTNEKYTENVQLNGQYDFQENIYRCLNPAAAQVQPGDQRLSPVVIANETIYDPMTIVQPSDFDVGRTLQAFQSDEMHTDQVVQDHRYTVGKRYGYDLFQEFIYRIPNVDDWRAIEGSTRLTHVDIKISPTDYSLQDWGINVTDAFCLFEIPSTGKSNSIGIESNIVTSRTDYFSVRLRSINKDIPDTYSSLSQGVLVGGDSYVFSTFLSDVSPKYAGYLGIEWFYDNGVNNKAAIKETRIQAHDLYDNFHIDGYSEEFLGGSSRSSDLDLHIPLFPVPSDVLFYDVTGNGFGVGDPVYIDNDNNAIVSHGDQRIIQTTVSVNFTETSYTAGSFVTDGDADTGNMLETISPLFRWADRYSGIEEQDLDGILQPGEPLYRKQTFVTPIAKVQANDIRIFPVVLSEAQYIEGTFVKPTTYFHRYSHFYGVSMQKNGLFSNIDLPVQPGCQEIKMEVSPQLKVEQTSQFDIHLQPSSQEQSICLFVDEPSPVSSTRPMPMVEKLIEKVKSPSLQEVTITPYKSSFSEKGWQQPLSVLVFVDAQGISYKPMNFIDPVYNSYFYDSEIDHRKERYEELLPDGFSTDYYTVVSFNVYPEDATIHPSKKCVSTFDLRFPNLWAHMKDADNPNDVNDPYPIISSQYGEQIVGNYNAKGAGIDYLFTAFAPTAWGTQRYIVQVNQDQSYCFWLWNDTIPKGILNFTDDLSFTPIFVYEDPAFHNNDCSEELFLYNNDPLGFNKITYGDEIGVFDGQRHEVEFWGSTFIIDNARVEKFGVDVLYEPFAELNEGDPGGDFPLALKPVYGDEQITLRTYACNALFDYNNAITHPPAFKQIETGQIQYFGLTSLKTPTVEDVNFTNVAIVDHGLQYSAVDYTAGEHPLYPLDDPVIASPYNPLVQNWQLDFIAYPAGQTHIGRTSYRRRYRRGSGAFGFSATPTISSQIYEDSPFRKLGTEQYPMTDYDFLFTLQTKAGEFIAFGDELPEHRRINKIIVEGPFKCPQILDREDGSVVPRSRIPLLYNETGKLVIDRNIAEWYQMPGENWTGSIGFGRDEIFFEEEDWNPLLVRTGILDYSGIPAVIKIPEITPLRSGTLHIKVILADGTEIELGDCCSEKPQVGLPVHGLSFENLPDSLEVFTDHVLTPTLLEDEPYQETKFCNNAFVILWQDRGIRYHASMLLDPYEIGAGDGRINFGASQWLDLNEDSKVAFADWETEIIGTYYLDTNTWAGGVFDGRTFNVDNGVYPLELSEDTGTQITQYGVDFCSRSGIDYSRRTDHIISKEEVTPVYMNAYKFYDDNGDRAFTPKYHWRSHEVYLAGEKSITIKPHEDLVIATYPSPLTAGCIPELVDPGNPLTFEVYDSSGLSVDFRFGVMDPNGRSDIDPEDAWQHLFEDTPKEPLPQYYWTRTDLHNIDNVDACNVKMYSKPNNWFTPIHINFDESYEGKYRFYNFLANDEGAFEVTVYSPDHLHMGRTFVTVAPAKVEYNIMPLFLDRKGNIRGAMDVRDPDFLMTAGVNKIYLLGLKAYTPQGRIIKGVDRTNPFRSKDQGETMTHSGRMTPYTTKPASFDLHENFDYVPDGYFLHMSVINDLEHPEVDLSNTFQMAGFAGTIYEPDVETTYYNTTNVRYDNGTFSKGGMIQPNPTMIANNGWGYGCIYNYPHDEVYMFPDFDNDGMLTKEDSFTIDKNGEVYFFVYAEDVCDVGVLINCNDFSDSGVFSDVVGKPPTFSDSPSSIWGRFRKEWEPRTGYSLADGVFKLDWDAFPERNISIRPPNTVIRNSEDQLPLRRDLLNPGNYDLVYGITNSLHIYVTPADNRDMPIEGGWVHLQGNQHESSIYGGVESIDRYTRRATISFTPTGIGEDTASLLYSSDNNLYLHDAATFPSPQTYVVDLHTHFDVLKAIRIVYPYQKYLIADTENEFTIQLQEKGTKAPIEGVTVSISGEGFSLTQVSNQNGMVTFSVNPPFQKNNVRIFAMKKGYFEAEDYIPVVEK